MDSTERYNEGLITLYELAKEKPAVAVQIMQEEYRRKYAYLEGQIKAMQCQLDAIVDAMYDRNRM